MPAPRFPIIDLGGYLIEGFILEDGSMGVQTTREWEGEYFNLFISNRGHATIKANVPHYLTPEQARTVAQEADFADTMQLIINGIVSLFREEIAQTGKPLAPVTGNCTDEESHEH